MMMRFVMIYRLLDGNLSTSLGEKLFPEALAVDIVPLLRVFWPDF